MRRGKFPLLTRSFAESRFAILVRSTGLRLSAFDFVSLDTFVEVIMVNLIRRILLPLLLLSVVYAAFLPVGQTHAATVMQRQFHYNGGYAQEADCRALKGNWVGVYGQDPDYPNAPWAAQPGEYQTCFEFFGTGWIQVPLYGNLYRNVMAINPTVKGYFATWSGNVRSFSATQTVVAIDFCHPLDAVVLYVYVSERQRSPAHCYQYCAG